MEKQLDPISYDEAKELLKLVDNSVEQLQIQVYDLDLKELLSSTLGIMNPIGQIAEWIISWFRNAISWIVQQIVGAAAWIYEHIVRPIIDVLSRLFGEFARALYEHVIEPVFGAIAIAGKKIVEFLESVWSGFVEFWRDPVGKMKEVLEYLGQRIWELIPDWVKTAFETVSKVFETVYKSLEEFMKDPRTWLQQHIVEPLAQVFSPILKAFETIKKFIDNVAEGIITFIKDPAGWFTRNILEPMKNFISTVWNILPREVRDAITAITTFFGSIADEAKRFASNPAGWINSRIVQPIVKGFESILAGMWKLLPDPLKRAISYLEIFLRSIISEVEAFVSNPVGWINNRIVNPIISGLKSVTKDFIELFGKIVDFLRNIVESIGGIRSSAEDLAKSITAALDSLAKRIWESLPGWFRSSLDLIARAIDSIKSLFSSAVDKIVSVISRIWEFLPPWLKEVFEGVKRAIDRLSNTLANLLRDPIGTLRAALSGIGQWIWNALPQWLRSALESIGRGLEGIKNVLYNFFRDPVGTIQQAIRNIGEWIWSKLPGWVRDTLEKVKEFLGKLWENIHNPKKLFRDFIEGFRAVWEFLWNIFKPVGEFAVEALEWFVTTLVRAIGRVASSATVAAIESTEPVVVELSRRSCEKFTGIFWKPLQKLVQTVRDEWYKVLSKAKGEIELVMDFGTRFGLAYFNAVIGTYVFTGLLKSLSNFAVQFAPKLFGSSALGLKFELTLREIITSITRAIEEFFPSFLMGTMMGIASVIFKPVEMVYRVKFIEEYDRRALEIFGEVLAQEIANGARINVFVEAPSMSSLKEWIRRMIALTGGIPVADGRSTGIPSHLVQYLATFKAHLKLRGLPKWYIDYLMDMGSNLVITFKDRFGVVRGVWLGEVFELPTHSELARMTQRDIFPSIEEMQKVAWVRGWNPDLTKMIYLLTFKYPSFEKLWKFYMRATAGLLWFSPPPQIKAVFDKEAEALGAGKPIPPLKIQEALERPEQFKVFELALNTYFKWLEYSNFSWFSPQTTLYDIPIGKLIYDTLGGWTADSWIMADVAADIPGKIDLRWMSRYGIFLWMADKAERAGVTFESYKPMVKAIPMMLESRPTSPIQVDLKWFSKLLQATGLHPAWVPIVTVAENIMVISDEMTLLRTGWLHLFKEGMLTVDDVEKYLAGIITVSYQVGYWDPEAKKWTRAWINLPVRWLPHERRLLQLRMLMDRVYDVFREFYGRLRSAIRTLALTPAEALAKLKRAIERLDKHYSSLAKKITGTEMHIDLDEDYAKLWLDIQTLVQDVEAVERVRHWWWRVSGWLLYRIAYGYVGREDVEKIIEQLSKVIPVHRKEVEAYRAIAETLLGIVRREYIPTPSQLATIAEIVPEAAAKIDEVLKARRIPEDWWDIWRKYVEVKPIVDDVRRIARLYRKALLYKAELGELERRIKELLRTAGWTDRELEILDLAVKLEELIEEAKALRREYIPTPSMLATLSEYVVVPDRLIEEVFEKRRVPEHWRSIWIQYIRRRPLADELRRLLSRYMRLKRYADIYNVDISDVEKEVKEILRAYGYTGTELKILELAEKLDVMTEEIREKAREWVPTVYQLATLAEWMRIPDTFVEEVLRRRRIPAHWRNFWKTYIEIAPYRDDFRRFLTDYFYAKVWGLYVRDVEDLARELMSKMNFDRFEQKIFEARAKLRRRNYAWREVRYWIRSTIRTIAYGVARGRLSEYEARRFFEMLERKGFTREEIEAMKMYYDYYVRTHRYYRRRR